MEEKRLWAFIAAVPAAFEFLCSTDLIFMLKSLRRHLSCCTDFCSLKVARRMKALIGHANEQHRQEGGKEIGRKILASLLLWKELSD